MTVHIITVTADQSLSNVRKNFESKEFRHLPVMGLEGLIGMITHRPSACKVRSS
jgi:CBS domain-containing protein